MNTWCANHIGGVECPARGAPYQVLYPALARSRGPSGKEECTTSSKRSKPSLYRDANGMTRHAAAKQAGTRLAQGRQQAPDGEHGGRADDHSSGAQRSHGNGCCCCTQSDRLDRSQLQEVIPAPSYLQLVNPWHVVVEELSRKRGARGAQRGARQQLATRLLRQGWLRQRYSMVSELCRIPRCIGQEASGRQDLIGCGVAATLLIHTPTHGRLSRHNSRMMTAHTCS